jgi:hypothetical protein
VRSHTRTTDPRECLAWDVWWPEPGDGTYDVTAPVTAAELAGREFQA